MESKRQREMRRQECYHRPRVQQAWQAHS